MRVILIVILAAVSIGCQITGSDTQAHFLDGIDPDKGGYGIRPGQSAGSWSVQNFAMAENRKFDYLQLHWSSSRSDLFMWITTAIGKSFCTRSDLPTEQGAIKVNSQWKKAKVDCYDGVLSFEFKDYVAVENMSIAVGLVFDRYGQVARTYDIRSYFDNNGAINAMKYAQLRSEENQREKSLSTKLEQRQSN